VLPMAEAHGVATIINRPFENGDIFRSAARKRLPDCASALGCTNWAQLFLKYIVSHPAVTCVIPATSRVNHLEENIAAVSEPLPDAAMRRAIVSAWEA
jgi:diketogulonate reductase-like aldo/keto reductase